MNRRGFLQALFAIPVLAAPLLVPESVATRPTQTKRMFQVVAIDRDKGIITLDSVGAPCGVRRIGMTRPAEVQRFEVGQEVTFPSLQALIEATS